MTDRRPPQVTRACRVDPSSAQALVAAYWRVDALLREEVLSAVEVDTAAGCSEEADAMRVRTNIALAAFRSAAEQRLADPRTGTPPASEAFQASRSPQSNDPTQSDRRAPTPSGDAATRRTPLTRGSVTPSTRQEPSR